MTNNTANSPTTLANPVQVFIYIYNTQHATSNVQNATAKDTLPIIVTHENLVGT